MTDEGALGEGASGVPAWLKSHDAAAWEASHPSEGLPALDPRRQRPTYPRQGSLVASVVYQMLISAVAAAWCAYLATHGHSAPLFGLGAFFATQQVAQYLMAFRVMRWNRPEGFTPDVVGPMVAELAHRAGVDAPRVVLVSAMPLAAVRLRRGRAVMLVGPRYSREATPENLRCVLAHEVAHVAANDLRNPARFVPLLVALAGYVAAFGSLFRAEGTAVIPLVWAFFPPYAVLVARATGLVTRGIEARADRGGAYLVGDGSAMAASLGDARVWVRRIRRVRYGPPWLAWVFAPSSIPATTHPTLDRRIARMESYPVAAPWVSAAGAGDAPPA